MPLSELIERLGRTIFEAPFSGAQLATDQPELAEIRLALLDEIKSKSHRVAGRYVFPHNLVRVQLLGVPEAQSTAFTGEFFPSYFQQELGSVRNSTEQLRDQRSSDDRQFQAVANAMTNVAEQARALYDRISKYS